MSKNSKHKQMTIWHLFLLQFGNLQDSNLTFLLVELIFLVQCLPLSGRSFSFLPLIYLRPQHLKLSPFLAQQGHSLGLLILLCLCKAFDEAILELDTLSEESYEDSTLIIQLDPVDFRHLGIFYATDIFTNILLFCGANPLNIQFQNSCYRGSHGRNQRGSHG